MMPSCCAVLSALRPPPSAGTSMTEMLARESEGGSTSAQLWGAASNAEESEVKQASAPGAQRPRT